MHPRGYRPESKAMARRIRAAEKRLGRNRTMKELGLSPANKADRAHYETLRNYGLKGHERQPWVRAPIRRAEKHIEFEHTLDQFKTLIFERMKQLKDKGEEINEEDTINLVNIFISAKVQADIDPEGYIVTREGKVHNTVHFRNMIWHIIERRLDYKRAYPIPWFGWEGHPY